MKSNHTSRTMSNLKNMPKISPLNRKANLLNLCKTNMKANRANCIELLRKFDRKQVATNILEQISLLPKNSTDMSAEKQQESTGAENNYKTESKQEDDIRDYLENEDYEYLLNQIMEELNNLESEELEYYHEETEEEHLDILLDDEFRSEQHHDKELLCPVCRVQSAHLYENTGCLICDCGFSIPLEGINIESLKGILAEAFEKHAAWSCYQCPSLQTNAIFPLQFMQSDCMSLDAKCSQCCFSERIFEVNSRLY